MTPNNEAVRRAPFYETRIGLALLRRWRDDGYDVLENGVVVGRIFLSPAAPQDRPWMWARGHNGDSVKRAAHGYEPTREAAMAAFAKSWRGK
jgi:hypothetical protein